MDRNHLGTFQAEASLEGRPFCQEHFSKKFSRVLVWWLAMMVAAVSGLRFGGLRAGVVTEASDKTIAPDIQSEQPICSLVL
jgi:hypothetical protein